MQWWPLQSVVIEGFDTATTVHQSSPSSTSSPMQGNRYGSQVKVIDLNTGYNLTALREDGVQGCVTKPSQGDTMMKTGKQEESFEAFFG